MTDNTTKGADKSQSGSDSDEKLQEELERESKEGRDGVGDVGSDRNLSGSSSWATTPKKDQPSTPRKDKA
jgi:hypothetical protein